MAFRTRGFGFLKPKIRIVLKMVHFGCCRMFQLITHSETKNWQPQKENWHFLLGYGTAKLGHYQKPILQLKRPIFVGTNIACKTQAYRALVANPASWALLFPTNTNFLRPKSAKSFVSRF
ncbi:LOW QUALITY PROTEIN: hypothetical protein PanWU01x14_107840 [Parasponia andersonii]|uniref:Uncharacterized protein n=1 Tax=Parasponia andersonii TaxID=3476 RepID=A0A2P5D0F8_PARAD|nr:LOW QUALITY PROTEIN: hypothetical protein PanWU01x14_107840 [Parasponia andersonii]